jgi:hypothetical protein
VSRRLWPPSLTFTQIDAVRIHEAILQAAELDMERAGRWIELAPTALRTGVKVLSGSRHRAQWWRCMASDGGGATLKQIDCDRPGHGEDREVRHALCRSVLPRQYS